MTGYSLGIDTSNYKTSIAIVDSLGNTIFEKSELLEVKKGERGLRHTDAFFMHSNRLPNYIEEAFSHINSHDIAAIGVSTKPRRLEGSYMPCFLAGYNTAKTIQSALNIPIYEFSHQEGHIASAVDVQYKDKFLLFHLSGGTSEYLICEQDEIGFSTKIVGGTKDISFGQLIDRIGVYLGYDFPAGQFVDEVALEADFDNTLFSDIKLYDAYFNLSGIETKLIRMIDEHRIQNDVLLASLFYKISKLIYISAKTLSVNYNIKDIYLAGGVSSSKTIKRNILRFKDNEKQNGIIPSDINIHFVEPKFCSDNAIGIARLCNRNYKNESGYSNTSK